MLTPLIYGTVATIAAAAAIIGWIALGSLVFPWIEDQDPARAPVAILIGSGITSFALATFSLAGMVVSGTLITASALVTAAVINRRRAFNIVRVSFGGYRAVFQRPLTGASLLSIAAVLVDHCDLAGEECRCNAISSGRTSGRSLLTADGPEFDIYPLRTGLPVGRSHTWPSSW